MCEGDSASSPVPFAAGELCGNHRQTPMSGVYSAEADTSFFSCSYHSSPPLSAKFLISTLFHLTLLSTKFCKNDILP
jgi:hypothetical protein